MTFDTRVHPWGRLPGMQRAVRRIWWPSDVPFERDHAMLAFGQGRSYGDTCLTPTGPVLCMGALDRFIMFDRDTGRFRCECGSRLDDVLKHIVPAGWTVPVVPGTQFITVGGAVANDIHGKNHHREGTFGNHVECFELVRSDGSRRVCSRSENSELFAATIGGLGLTGIITWLEIRLRPIETWLLDVETQSFASLDDFVRLTHEADKDWEYTAAWFDVLSYREGRLKGLFSKARPGEPDHDSLRRPLSSHRFSVPHLPGALVSPTSIQLFNAIYYRRNKRRTAARVPFDAYHFPLDAVLNWNRLYGRRGFFQFQCAFPEADLTRGLAKVLGLFASMGEGSFLATLKRFGRIASPGLLSFPQPGLTLTLDFRNRGVRTVQLIRQAYSMVIEHGGRIYPAKDACMTSEIFRASFPAWRNFAKWRDPGLLSAFWIRVMNQQDESANGA